MDMTNSCTVAELPANRRADWYLVQCKSRQDERAEENLTRQGYECLRPLACRIRVVREQRKFFFESLFPGYLFVNLPDNANWSPLRSTRGVSHVVSFGGRPLPVANSLVLKLRNRCELIEDPDVKSGDGARVLERDYAELDTILMANDGEERAIMLVSYLSRQQGLSFSAPKIAVC